MSNVLFVILKEMLARPKFVEERGFPGEGIKQIGGVG